MSNDDASRDPLVPVNTDGSAIHWDKNEATIYGALHQFTTWTTRTGRHRELLTHGTVTDSRGKTFMDDLTAIPFIIEKSKWEPSVKYTIYDPCPPSADRRRRREELEAKTRSGASGSRAWATPSRVRPRSRPTARARATSRTTRSTTTA